MQFFSSTQKGFVILFSVLISAIILLITVGIFGITTKQTILSSSAREAHVALGAADSAVEGVLMLDIRDNELDNYNLYHCGKDNLEILKVPADMFRIKYTADSDPASTPAPCAYITVNRTSEDEDNPGIITTTIQARGFNLCADKENRTPQFSDPLLVERVYEVSYSRIPVNQN